MATEEKRLYESSETIHHLHWERLAALDPAVVAKRALAEWDGGKFALPFFDEKIIVFPGERKTWLASSPGVPAGFPQGLTALSYLYGAIDAEPSGELVSLLELPGGATFFHGHHAPATDKIAGRFGKNPGEFRERAAARGWTLTEPGDGSARIQALPKIALQLVLWAEDEGFPASATFLIESRAHLYMNGQLDAIWAITNCAVEQLLKD